VSDWDPLRDYFARYSLYPVTLIVGFIVVLGAMIVLAFRLY
jgi:hypothetical protein